MPNLTQLTTEQLRDIYSAICQELAQRETLACKEFDADESTPTNATYADDLRRRFKERFGKAA